MVSEYDIRQIVQSVIAERTRSAAANGSLPEYCFDDMGKAVEAAADAARRYGELGFETRRAVVEAMRRAALENAAALAEAAFTETGYGTKEHKILKCRLAAEKTPGVEDIVTDAVSGDEGLTLTAHAPYGVIGAITPSTNPVATIVNNAIGMTAAGNTVVFAPHPLAKSCSFAAISVMNQAVLAAGCSVPLLFCVREPSIKTSNALMNHPAVKLLVVTGGEAIVQLAMKTGKKVIAAGPGNPPVIVDETADIARAAKDIVDGASFENNILCIAEKEVFVVDRVGKALVAEMVHSGAQLLDPREAEVIQKRVLIERDGGYVINRDCVGRDAAWILRQAGIAVKGSPRLIVCIAREDHLFVTTELLMPILPVVFVADVETAIRSAVKAERGCQHSAYMHSTNVENMSRAVRALNTTLFVKNAPSYAGLGYQGEGHCTFTIATPTGEGITSAKCFTRARRCVLHGSFHIV